ncbi:hypothetical protein C8Q77DRAFT_1159832 [Trametes polyzona]|nr:hypothetical protein C8Q77DRAFT_1159832 [Trametes polyzona]
MSHITANTPSSSGQRTGGARFSAKDDAALFKKMGIKEDRDVKEGLPVYLARITYEERGKLHWSIVWPAILKADAAGRGSANQQYGWHMFDIQQQNRSAPGGANAPLAFRYQYKEPQSMTTRAWILHLLQNNVDVARRACIFAYAEGWLDTSVGGNCITCICEVIKDLVKDKILEPHALQVLQTARAADMQVAWRVQYHEAAAW